MHLTRTLAGAVAIALAATTFTGPAQAGHRNDDAWIAGAVGFGVGALFGGALAQPRYYHSPRPYYYQPAPPPPVYYEPAPVYVQLAPVYVEPANVYSSRPAPWSPEWYAYCDGRYRSFNPSTGYFLGYDGGYHFCR